MRELNKIITKLLKDNRIDIRQFQGNDDVSYPYSLQARITAYLLGNNIISFDDYQIMYDEFKARNPYLNAFEMAPRTFGETFVENIILEKHRLKNEKGFIKAKKKEVEKVISNYKDPLGNKFKSQFDFICFNGSEHYKVEVKACRANATSKKDISSLGDFDLSSSITSRAYNFSEASNQGFKFHFQQLKPGFCDVFIFVGVCTDKILYWVLTSIELRNLGGLSPQHPSIKKALTDPDYEGQISKSIGEFSGFSVAERDIFKTIIEKCSSQNKGQTKKT